MMDDQTIEQVAKMLRAQLRGAGHLWWIGGYVYGVTGNGDPFVILYPADEKLQEKVVRVYAHDFKKLPAFVPTDVDGGDTEANPNKEQARKKGIYHECPMFEVVTFDGNRVSAAPGSMISVSISRKLLIGVSSIRICSTS